MRSLDLSGNVGFGVQEAVEVTKALATSKCAANIESVNLSSTAVHQHGSFVDDGLRPPCAHNTDECYVLRLQPSRCCVVPSKTSSRTSLRMISWPALSSTHPSARRLAKVALASTAAHSRRWRRLVHHRCWPSYRGHHNAAKHVAVLAWTCGLVPQASQAWGRAWTNSCCGTRSQRRHLVGAATPATWVSLLLPLLAPVTPSVGSTWLEWRRRTRCTRHPSRSPAPWWPARLGERTPAVPAWLSHWQTLAWALGSTQRTTSTARLLATLMLVVVVLRVVVVMAVVVPGLPELVRLLVVAHWSLPSHRVMPPSVRAWIP